MNNMMTERNKKLYWQWFAIFICSTIIFAYLSDSVTKLLSGNLKEEYRTLLASALSLASLPAIAIYGFFMNYFPGAWFNEIRRGRSAIIWNIVLIVIYVIALALVG